MRKSKHVFLVLAVLATIVISGCGTIPQQEIDNATAAIDSARVAGAEIYASERFTALQDSMRVAMESIEAGRSKIIKNYSDSKEMLEQVTVMAGEVKSETEAMIEEIKSQVQSTINEIELLVAENRQLLSEAPRGKEGTSALVAIRNEIELVEVAVNEAAQMYENSNFKGANDRVISARDKAVALNSELKEVIAKYKLAVRSR